MGPLRHEYRHARQVGQPGRQTTPDGLPTGPTPTPEGTRTMRQLTALARLEDAGLTGDDATTSLDTFIARTAAELATATEGMPAWERHDYLAARYGSDAVRAATVLTAAEAGR